MLYTKDHEVMEDDKTLSEYGYTTTIARAQSPGFIGLALRLIYFKIIAIRLL